MLAERWSQESTGVRFFAMHPGWVDTPGVESALPSFYRVTKRWLRTPAQGADTAVWLSAALEPDVDDGAFVFDRQSAPRHMLPGTRATESERARLWDVLEGLASR